MVTKIEFVQQQHRVISYFGDHDHRCTVWYLEEMGDTATQPLMFCYAASVMSSHGAQVEYLQRISSRSRKCELFKVPVAFVFPRIMPVPLARKLLWARVVSNSKCMSLYRDLQKTKHKNLNLQTKLVTTILEGHMANQEKNKETILFGNLLALFGLCSNLANLIF